jgi:hypothetical protein
VLLLGRVVTVTAFSADKSLNTNEVKAHIRSDATRLRAVAGTDYTKAYSVAKTCREKIGGILNKLITSAEEAHHTLLPSLFGYECGWCLCLQPEPTHP